MTIDEAGIRKAILLLNAQNVTYAGHVWDLYGAYLALRAELKVRTETEKPTLRAAMNTYTGALPSFIRAAEPRSFAENANLPGSDDIGTVEIDSDNTHYHQPVLGGHCAHAARWVTATNGAAARALGATPCRECYRDWPGTDGPADCYYCTTETPCPTHTGGRLPAGAPGIVLHADDAS